MKVMAFNARPDERAFFDHFGQSLNMDLELQPGTLTVDNAGLTRGFDGISCTCDLPAPVLEKLAENGVRYAALRTIGYDNVDLEAAKRLGIRVSHAGYSPYSVANYTVMLMLMCIRKAVYIMFRSHTADNSLGAAGSARGMEMQNLTVGVIGTGRIGKAVIQNLSGFGCHIVAHDPYPSEEMKKMGVEYVSLDSLYAQSDIVTLHTFLNDETFHMINAESIRKMKPGVVIINCARGALIDTRALIEGIESGRIGSAWTASRARMTSSAWITATTAMSPTTTISFSNPSRTPSSHRTLRFSPTRQCSTWYSARSKACTSLMQARTCRSRCTLNRFRKNTGAETRGRHAWNAFQSG